MLRARQLEMTFHPGTPIENRVLRGLDLSWQKARPVHPEADPRAQERFKKTCPG